MDKETFHREDDRLDDLFRESLGNMQMEPSARVWKRISRTLLTREVLRFNFSNLSGIFWGILPAAVVITGIVLYFGMVPGDPTNGSPLAEVVIPLSEQYAPVESPDIVSPVVTSSPDAVDPLPVMPITEPVASVAEPVASVAEPVASVAEPVASSVSTTTPAATALMEPDIPESSTTMTSVPLELSLTSLRSLEGTLHTVTPLFPDMIPLIPAAPAPPVIPLRTPVPQGLDIGVNITPDMVFYQNASGSFKYNYTFDLATRYRFGRFSLQTGVGLTYSTAIGDYAISYRKNDSVGYYYEIQSYTIDPGNPSSGISFETKQVTVYDSMEYLYDYNTKNQYLYLQVPLTLGYRIIDKPRWSVSADAGLFYAWLFSVNEPAPSFYIPESRILEVQRLTPERNRHIFGLSGGISVEYRFARNFFLMIEPTFKYYMQAVDESSSEGVRQPYSVGLRAGIWYRLNFKSKAK